MVVLLIILLLLVSGCHDREITLESLLKEISVREALTYFPENEYKLIQVSSYNRASVSPDENGWFENNDMSHFIRIEENNGRREFVMLDAEGPGVIVRWWMTFYKAQNGTIRIYIDNDSVATISGSPDKLLSGNMLAGYPLSASVQKGAPIGEEGRDYDHNLYLPIPFNSFCKITYECDSLKVLYDYEGTSVPEGYWWPDVFYNICYRHYNPKTLIESFTAEALKRAGPLLEQTAKDLLLNEVNLSDKKEFEEQIQPDDSLVIEIIRKQHAIHFFSVKTDALNINQALRSTVLKITFDNNQTVWMPVGEFFGCGYSLSPHKTWMNTSDGKGNMESFWVMPFREKCVITLLNYGNEKVKISGIIGLNPYQWKASSSMYFGASWHEYYRIKSRNEKNSPFDLNFVNIKGKGVYVGDQINLFNNTYLWWGEGDEKIFVDGESFPSIFGTGSEDYYGYSFGRQEAFSHPFLSQPVGVGNMDWGITINMRHRSLDAIPFTTSIDSNIELWHWASIHMNYAMTSYYYVMLPFTVNTVNDAENVKRQVILNKEDFNQIDE